MVTHVAQIFPLSLSSNSINRKNYTLTQVLTISLPFLLRLDRRIPDQNMAKRLELPHELPPYWILLPTMHFKPTGIEGCEGLWVGKLLAQMVKKYFKTRKIYILQVWNAIYDKRITCKYEEEHKYSHQKKNIYIKIRIYGYYKTYLAIFSHQHMYVIDTMYNVNIRYVAYRANTL